MHKFLFLLLCIIILSSITIINLLICLVNILRYEFTVVRYSERVNPICVGKRGDAKVYPLGIAVDYKTGNIFTVDRCNLRIQVFDRSGDFLFMVGKERLLIC